MPVGEPHLHPATLWEGVRIRLVFAYRGAPPVHGRTGRFTPDWFSSWWVEQGRAEVEFAHLGRFTAVAGEWLLLPPTLERRQDFAPRTRILSVAFQWLIPPHQSWKSELPSIVPDAASPQLRRRAEGVLATLPTAGPPGQGGKAFWTASEWLEHQARTLDFASAWSEVSGFQWRIASDGAATPPAPDPRLVRARRCLREHCRIGPVPYRVLTLATGLGAVQINRLFRAQWKSSPKRELDRELLRLAVEQLGDPRQSVKTVASGLGFSDSSHFCKWFSRQTGLTPRLYQRGMKV